MFDAKIHHFKDRARDLTEATRLQSRDMALEYLHKFRSGIAGVAAQVSSVLPGNPVLRELDIGPLIATAGPALAWKIYAATKRSSKQPVAVWVYEKRDDRFGATKAEREAFTDLLRKGVARLTRLRHPRLLTVDTALDESRDSLAFCTEPVWSSLANVLYGCADVRNGAQSGERSASPPVDVKLDVVEIKHGLYQLTEALWFLHNDAHQSHRNVCPESVIINERGCWKLASFDFAAQALEAPDTLGTGAPVLTYPALLWDSSSAQCMQPAMDYMAPEHLLAEDSSVRVTSATDMFSLGCLCHAVFHHQHRAPFDHQHQLSTAKRNLDKIKSTIPQQLLVCLPADFREDVKMCLMYSPELRPDAQQFSKLSFFDDDLLVKTLRYFETLCQMDNAQKAQLFKGLPNVLPQFSKRILLQQVMYWLASESRTPDLVPFILPSIFTIAEQTNDEEFKSTILPSLLPIFAMRHPYQIPLMLLQRMELLLGKTNDDDVRQHVLPLIYNALDSDMAKVQELCLGIIPTIGRMVDRDSMKGTLLPKLIDLAVDAQVLSIRVNALVCMGKLVPTLEKWMIAEQILPALTRIQSREPGVLMAVLGIYKLVFHNDRIGSISKETCAKSALPYLMATSIDNSLNVQQFDAFIALIREMVDKVHTEHRQKLATLSSMQQEQRAVKDFTEVLSEKQAKLAISPEIAALSMTSSSSVPSALNNAGAGQTKQVLTLDEKRKLAAAKEQQSSKPAGAPKAATLTPMTPTAGALPRPPAPVAASSGAIDLTSLLLQSGPTMAPRPMSATSSSSMATTSWSMDFGPMQQAAPPPNTLRPTSAQLQPQSRTGANTIGGTQPSSKAFDDLVMFPNKSESKNLLNTIKPTTTPASKQRPANNASALDDLFK